MMDFEHLTFYVNFWHSTVIMWKFVGSSQVRSDWAGTHGQGSAYQQTSRWLLVACQGNHPSWYRVRSGQVRAGHVGSRQVTLGRGSTYQQTNRWLLIGCRGNHPSWYQSSHSGLTPCYCLASSSWKKVIHNMRPGSRNKVTNIGSFSTVEHCKFREGVT